MRFKIDRASLIVGSKFTVFALFYFVFEGNFLKPPGSLYLEGRFNGGFFALPVWGAYIWRGLFSEFYGIIPLPTWPTLSLRIMVVVGLRGSSLKLRYILQAM